MIQSGVHLPLFLQMELSMCLINYLGGKLVETYMDFYQLKDDGYSLETVESYELGVGTEPDSQVVYYNDKETLTDEEFWIKLDSYIPIIPDM